MINLFYLIIFKKIKEKKENITMFETILMLIVSGVVSYFVFILLDHYYQKLKQNHFNNKRTLGVLTSVIIKIPPNEIVGRKGDLENLRKSLNTNKGVVVVHGMGGIGKTTLAAAYVSEYYRKYKHLAWITIRDSLPDALLTDAALLNNLKVDTQNLKPEEQFAICLNKLRNLPGRNLLVLDNAHQSLATYRTQLPGAPNWHVLITSREQIPDFPNIPLNFLSPHEAVKLFKKHCPNCLADNEIEQLVKKVEYHTLTIELLSRSANKNRWNFPTIQNALQLDLPAGVSIQHSGEEKIDRIQSYLTRIFNISHLSDNEKYLLTQFVALPNFWIPYSLLTRLLKLDTLPWKDSFAGTLNDLWEKGFLLRHQDHQETDSYKMHLVLAQALRKQLEITPRSLAQLIQGVTEILSIDYAKDNPVEKFPYIPYGEAILQALPAATSPDIAKLQNNLATVYYNLGDYERARELLEQALESDIRNFGEDHPTVAITMNNLAMIYHKSGESQKAVNLARKAYDIFRARLGKDHPYTRAARKLLQSLT